MSPDLLVVIDLFENLMEGVNASEKCTECGSTHILHIILKGSQTLLGKQNKELGRNDGPFTLQNNSLLKKKKKRICSQAPKCLPVKSSWFT